MDFKFTLEREVSRRVVALLRRIQSVIAFTEDYFMLLFLGLGSRRRLAPVSLSSLGFPPSENGLDIFEFENIV